MRDTRSNDAITADARDTEGHLSKSQYWKYHNNPSPTLKQCQHFKPEHLRDSWELYKKWPSEESAFNFGDVFTDESPKSHIFPLQVSRWASNLFLVWHLMLLIPTSVYFKQVTVAKASEAKLASCLEESFSLLLSKADLHVNAYVKRVNQCFSIVRKNTFT